MHSTKDKRSVIRPERYYIPGAVSFDKNVQLETFVPKVLQCSRCWEAFHTKASRRMKEEICRYCLRVTPFKEGQLAKANTDLSSQTPTAIKLIALVSTGIYSWVVHNDCSVEMS